MTFVVHREAAFLGIQGAGHIDACIAEAAAIGSGDPIHLPGGSAVKKSAIRSHEYEWVPAGDVARLGNHVLPGDAVEALPTAAGRPTFGGVGAAIASDGENAAIGQGDAGVVPAAVVHVGHGAPRVGAPVEDAAEAGGITAAIDDDAAIGQHCRAAAEHVVAVVVDFREGTGFGVPNSGVGELGTDREGGALVGRKGQQTTVRQVGGSDRNVWRPIDDVAPFAQTDASGGSGGRWGGSDKGRRQCFCFCDQLI